MDEKAGPSYAYPVMVLVTLLVGVGLGAVYSFDIGRDSIRKEAIELGHAYYHPQTGDFTWMPAQKPDTDKAQEGDGDE